MLCSYSLPLRQPQDTKFIVDIGSASVQAQVLPIKLPASFFSRALFMAGQFALVAERCKATSRELVGCIMGSAALLDDNTSTAYISTLVVSTSARRMGVATLLSSKILAMADSVRLHCAASNQAALQLYASLGFRQTGRAMNHYRFNNKSASITTAAQGKDQSQKCAYASSEALILERCPWQ